MRPAAYTTPQIACAQLIPVHEPCLWEAHGAVPSIRCHSDKRTTSRQHQGGLYSVRCLEMPPPSNCSYFA